MQQSLVADFKQRRGVHQVHDICCASSRIGADHHLLFLRDIGNRGLDLAEHQARGIGHARSGTAHGHRLPIKHQLSIDLRECWPWQAACGQCAAWHVIQHRTCDLSCDTKFALAGIGKRHVKYISFDFEAALSDLAFQHRIAHVIARFFLNKKRQVAMHLRALTASQAALQIQNAWEARFCSAFRRIGGFPEGFGVALHIGIGEFDLRYLQLNLLARDLPIELGAQLIEHERWLLKHTG